MSRDKSLELITEVVAQMPMKERTGILQNMDEMHVVTFITWLGAGLGQEEFKSDKSPKELVEGYIEQFAKSLRMSAEATCTANGWTYDPAEDHNKKVRDEILREIDG